MWWIAYDAHVGVAIERIGSHHTCIDLKFVTEPPGRIELPTCRLQGGCSTD